MLKYILLVLILSTVIPQSLLSQNGWVLQQNPLKEVHDIEFLNSLTGYACGDSGRIIKTTNGGNTWDVVYFHSDFRDYKIVTLDFINVNTGVAAGHEPFTGIGLTGIWRTTNGGAGWQFIGSTTTFDNLIEQDIKMLNKDTIVYARTGSTGLSVNGELKYTSNGGVNWTNGPFLRGFNSLNFIDNKTGWVNEFYYVDVGNTYNKIYKTTNSGLNWFVQKTDTMSYALPLSLDFINQNTGFAIGTKGSSTKFLKTTTGGTTWDSSFFNLGANIKKILFINNNTGWIFGSAKLFKTTNAGNNWNETPQSLFGNINNLFFLNPDTGWACGSKANTRNSIAKTGTGGIMNIESFVQTAEKYQLWQNYPNPFNPVTKIRFSLPERNHVKLTVYDVMGRQMDVLVDEQLASGSYEKTWNAEHLSSGIYFYKIQTGNFSQLRKMILLK